MAISDYISAIGQQRDILKNNLKLKGVSVEGCTKFNELTPKVLEISGSQKVGAQNGVWTPTVTAESFTLTGLGFIPAKFSICCEDVLTKNYTSVTDHINIAILNIELSNAEIEIIKNSSADGVVLESGDVTADVIIDETDGVYSVTISFAELNQTAAVPYKFKANASHVWCVAEEGWLI